MLLSNWIIPQDFQKAVEFVSRDTPLKTTVINDIFDQCIIEDPSLTASRAGEPEPGVFGSLEPEPLIKKPGAGAAWKKVRSLSRSR